MKHEQLERICAIADALLVLPPERRMAALDTLCPAGEDAAVRARVEKLLHEDARLEDQLAELYRTDASETSFTAAAPLLSTAEIDAAAEPPAVIGRYHLRTRLGGGGMGEVYLAEQRASIRQTVAIKLIKPGFDSREVIARFGAERQALARMDHPNIARVLDAGVTQSARPYFVMEYVPGTPITDFADEQRLTIRQRLSLFVDVCDAIAHAHTKGVIHRDLKPSNLLAFMADGAPRVKVIDFGIAKALDRDDRLTQASYATAAGLVLGTYEYMSPEQAAGSTDVDTRSDVYSLGVLLYELLTGVRPFERNGRAKRADDELRRQIREVEPPRPSTRVRWMSRGRSPDLSDAAKPADEPSRPTTTCFQAIATARSTEPRALERTLARELEWIPMKALRKDGARRYTGAAELAADVRNYLAGRPLTAAPESRMYRYRKFVVRHRAPLAVAATVLLLLVAGAIGTTIGLLRESAARKLADENGRRATWSAYRSAIAAADAARRNGDGVRLGWALDAAPPALRGWEWSLLSRGSASATAELRRLPGERFAATHPLPDGRRAWSVPVIGAAPLLTPASSTTSAACVLWDLSSGEVIRREPGRFLAIDPAGERVAVVRGDGSLDVSEIDTGQVRWRVPAPSPGAPWKLCENSFALDSSSLVSWNDGDSSVTIFNAGSGEARRLPLSARVIGVLGFVDLARGSAAGELVLYVEGVLQTLRVDTITGETTRESGIEYVIGRQPLTNFARGFVRPTSSQAPVYRMPRRGLVRGNVVLYPDQSMLAYGRDNGSIALMRVEESGGDQAEDEGILSARATKDELNQFIVGRSPVVALAATPDRGRLIATLDDGSVRVVPFEQPTTVAVPLQGARAFALSPDESRFVVAGWGDILCLEPISGLPLWGRNLGPHDNRHIAWSPDGRTVVVVARPVGGEPAAQSEVFVLDGHSGEQLAALSSSAVTIDASRPAVAPTWAQNACGATFSHDGRTLLLARSDGSIVRIDVKTWEPVGDTAATTSPAADERYGPLVRGRDRIAQIFNRPAPEGSSRSGGLVIRDPTDGAVLRRFDMPGFEATQLAWNPNGTSLAAGFSRAGESIVVGVDAGSLKVLFRTPAGSGAEVRAIAFTPDGGRIVAATSTRRLLIADATSGEEIMTSTMEREAAAVLFTNEGALITTGEGFGLIRTDAENPEALFARALQHWPANVARPTSLNEARKWVAEGHSKLLVLYDAGVSPNAAANAALSDEPRVRALVGALALRRAPNINLLNSGALSISMGAKDNPESLKRCIPMLETAVAIKPHSASLQRNLGAIQFQAGLFAECRGPLVKSEEIRTSKNLPSSPATKLMVAIASQRCGDGNAESMYRDALAEVARLHQESDPEVRALIEQAKGDFTP